MASNTAPKPAGPPANSRTLELHVPKKQDRKIFVAKFGPALGLDFSKWKQNAPELSRDLTVYPEDTAKPKEEEGAKGPVGSELGKDRREAAKQRKYTRHKKPGDAPWVLTDNATTTKKKYRGIKEGSLQDNAAYYIFTTVGGKIEAYPVSEWFNFTPVQRYKTLTSEEAEEAFQNRHKVLNHFNLMAKNKATGNKDDGNADEEEMEGGKKGGQKKSLKIRNVDDDEDRPQVMSDSEEEGAAGDTKAVDGITKKGKGKGKKKAVKKAQKKKERPTDGEAHEDSDDGDYETRELDYDEVAAETSEDDSSSDEEEVAKGVDEEVQEMEEDEEEEEQESAEVKPEEGAEGDDGSGSENDEEDFDAIADSVLPAGKRTEGAAASSSSSQNEQKSKGSKRKQESDSPDKSSKKSKASVPSATPSSAASSDGKFEDEVRRYLDRKPLTMQELLKKLLKKENVPKERHDEFKVRLGEVLKRINPDKKNVGGKLYLHLKK